MLLGTRAPLKFVRCNQAEKVEALKRSAEALENEKTQLKQGLLQEIQDSKLVLVKELQKFMEVCAASRSASHVNRIDRAECLRRRACRAAPLFVPRVQSKEKESERRERDLCMRAIISVLA